MRTKLFVYKFLRAYFVWVFLKGNRTKECKGKSELGYWVQNWNILKTKTSLKSHKMTLYFKSILNRSKLKACIFALQQKPICKDFSTNFRNFSNSFRKCLSGRWKNIPEGKRNFFVYSRAQVPFHNLSEKEKFNLLCCVSAFCTTLRRG